MQQKHSFRNLNHEQIIDLSFQRGVLPSRRKHLCMNMISRKGIGFNLDNQKSIEMINVHLRSGRISISGSSVPHVWDIKFSMNGNSATKKLLFYIA